ncbi:MAG: hypothetical protein M5U32_20020 [Myxococcota bacterium]|nr:hypothetical protein [Myxococcota bacterium]
MFEKCEASGLSPLTFDQREGIPRSTFTRWQQRLRIAPSPPEAARFIALPLVATGEDASLSSAALELSLPGGVVRWRW